MPQGQRAIRSSPTGSSGTCRAGGVPRRGSGPRSPGPPRRCAGWAAGASGWTSSWQEAINLLRDATNRFSHGERIAGATVRSRASVRYLRRMSIPIILDCDPGIDDALAIAFAAGSPEIELAGITTVAGNVPLARTTANALAVAAFAGLPDVPVTPGC